MTRRTLMAAAVASSVRLKAERLRLTAEHRKALSRSRRIFFQCDTSTFDPPELYGTNIDAWIAYRFGYVDQPGSQIDTFCLDVSNEGLSPYPSRILQEWQQSGLQKWRAAGVDYIGEILKACRKRNKEVFWNHRMSEVERGPGGLRIGGGTDPNFVNQVKKEHPDWVIRSWWWQGNWNLASEGARQYKLAVLREVAERYEFDGIQLDFARHIPVLPPGSQWELRDHVTRFLDSVREMLLKRAAERGRPLLLAVKIPQNLEGCKRDGFDVVQWVDRRLVDILTLGSRSIDVDVAAFRNLVQGTGIRLQPSLDDWHATDGYRNPPIEFLRGVFGNWWHQDVDGVATFNWSSASPEEAVRIGALAGPAVHQIANREIGSLDTIRGKSRFYAIERRGGYPFAEGYFNRNDDAPLPVVLTNHGTPANLSLNVWEDLQGQPLRLRLVLFQVLEADQVGVNLNGRDLTQVARDASCKDPQIFSPGPQPISGGFRFERKDLEKQHLCRIDFEVPAAWMKRGGNEVKIRVKSRGVYRPGEDIQVEKLELHVDEA